MKSVDYITPTVWTLGAIGSCMAMQSCVYKADGNSMEDFQVV